jgi:hypothetical protein
LSTIVAALELVSVQVEPDSVYPLGHEYVGVADAVSVLRQFEPESVLPAGQANELVASPVVVLVSTHVVPDSVCPAGQL